MNLRTYMAVPRQLALALDLDQEPSPLHGRTPRERFEVIALSHFRFSRKAVSGKPYLEHFS